MQSDIPPEKRPNLFERHPRKTLAAVVLLAVAGLALASDRLLALRWQSPGLPVERFVRLRELAPGTVESISPVPEIFDREAGSSPRPVLLRADAEGFIIPSRVHARPDLKLAFLGGSTTECRAVPEDQRFPYLAGRCLETALGLKVNSYNAARSGNHSLHSLNLLLHKLMPLAPDAVVMMHNINDLVTLLYERTYWNTNPSRRLVVEIRPTLTGQVRGFFQVLRQYTIPHLYLAIKSISSGVQGKAGPDEFARVRGQPVEIRPAYLEREFRANLESFVGLCRARDILPVLMTQANRLEEELAPELRPEVERLERQGIPYRVFQTLYQRFNQVIREVARAHQVPVIDLAREIPPDPRYLFDTVHFTERGSKEAARIICAQLQLLLKGRLGEQRGLPGREARVGPQVRPGAELQGEGPGVCPFRQGEVGAEGKGPKPQSDATVSFPDGTDP